MKSRVVVILISLIYISCSSFEEDHQIKEGVRKYLEQTLHDPNSVEEISWTISMDYKFKYKDSLDNKSPFIIDYEQTFDNSDSLKIRHVRLIYRAANGFGALRKSEIYATDLVNGHLQFEDAAYVYDSESLFNVESSGLMEPRRLFLKNQFFKRNEGMVTMEDFWIEYPEYD